MLKLKECNTHNKDGTAETRRGKPQIDKHKMDIPLSTDG